jgi:hypothetical protein
VSGFTLLQRTAPDEVIGRVFGLLETSCLAALGFGSLIAAVLLDKAGIEAALIVVGALLPVLVALRWRAVLELDAFPVALDDVALLKGIDIFAPLGPVEIERLAEALEPVRVPAGEAIVRQGDPGERFFVVVAGAVEVSVDGAVVREEGPGDYFGEIALLNDSPRTATVTARDDVELRALDRTVFLATVTGHDGSSMAVEAIASRRLATARPVAVAG